MSNNAMAKCFCGTFFTLFLLFVPILSVENVEDLANCTVGTTNNDETEPKVIGGTEVEDMKKYPFIVSITTPNFYLKWGFCGGALITDQYVLTAAHCIQNLDVWDILQCNIKLTDECFRSKEILRVGLLGSDKRKPAEEVEIDSFIVHPGYNKDLLMYDIALIKLKTPITHSEYTRPISISKEELVKPGDEVNIAGFGRYIPEKDSDYSKVLLEGTVKSVECSRFSNEPNPDKLLCFIGTNQNMCKGDSGTVAFKEHNGLLYAVGITSYHSDIVQCIPTKPTYYTKISSYYNFITKHVKNLVKTKKGKEHFNPKL